MEGLPKFIIILMVIIIINNLLKVYYYICKVLSILYNSTDLT